MPHGDGQVQVQTPTNQPQDYFPTVPTINAESDADSESESDRCQDDLDFWYLYQDDTSEDSNPSGVGDLRGSWMTCKACQGLSLLGNERCAACRNNLAFSKASDVKMRSHKKTWKEASNYAMPDLIIDQDDDEAWKQLSVPQKLCSQVEFSLMLLILMVKFLTLNISSHVLLP